MKYWIVSILTIVSIAIQAQSIVCVNQDPTNANDMLVTWEAPAAPCGPFVDYELWASTDEAGPFSLISTITDAAQTTETHSGALASNSVWYYYVVFNYNCGGTPAELSDTTTNLFNSHQPVITNLNATDTGIIITWDISTFGQTQGYIISYLTSSGLASPLDTVFGINNTTFRDTISIPTDPNLVYTISLLDGCGVQSSFNTVGYQLVQLNEPQQDGCDRLIEFSWEQYVNPYNVGYQYHIYIQVNDTGSLDLVATQDSFATTFNFFDFIDGDTIFFLVEIVDDNGVVRSNHLIEEVVARIVQPPRWFYIYNLSVNSNNQVEIYFHIDTLAELRNLTINHSLDDSDYDRVERFDAIDYPNLGAIGPRFDTIGNPSTNAYYYEVVANDSCNVDHFSTKGRTIWLQGQLNDFFLNEVTWNAFELDSANIHTYRLYRDYGAGMQLIETISGGSVEYTQEDMVDHLYAQSGEFCYRVEADYTLRNHEGITENYTTRSNTVCLEQRPSIYIPNAIVPGSQNGEFKPLIVFGNPTDYSLQIFSRWGAKIFESNNPDVGWFGTNGSDLVPTGGYAYVISFRASDGTPIEKKGIVSVIR